MAFHSNGQLFELIYIYIQQFIYLFLVDRVVRHGSPWSGCAFDVDLLGFSDNSQKKISTLFEIRVNPVFDPSYTWSTLSA